MDAALELYNELDNRKALLRLVGTAEHLRLDCKEVPNGNLQRSVREPISKAMSGMCNAEGGVIVLGVRAKRDASSEADVIQQLTPIENIDSVYSQIMADLGHLLDPSITVETKIIRERSTRSAGYLVFFVPTSTGEPHRAMDGKYYRRHGSTTLVMEHYELSEMFGRRSKPELRFWWKVGNQYGVNDNYRLDVFVGIQNVGRGVAKYPALLLIDTPVSQFGLDGNGNLGLPERPITRSNSHLFGGGADHVIYPGSTLEVTAARFHFGVQGWIELNIQYEIYADGVAPVSGSQCVRNDTYTKV